MKRNTVAKNLMNALLIGLLVAELALPFPYVCELARAQQRDSHANSDDLTDASSDESALYDGSMALAINGPSDDTEARQHLHLVLSGEVPKDQHNPLDEFRLLQQEAIKSKQPNNVRYRNLGLEVRDGYNNKLITRTYQVDAASQLQANAAGVFEDLPNGGSFVLTYQDEALHRFHIKARQVGFYKNYLVFLTAGADAQSANLSFIDLKRFAANLGRGIELPVFRIPFHQPAVHSNLSYNEEALALTFGGQTLAINDNLIMYFAELQDIGLNVLSSLVNPETYEKTKHLVAEIELLFQKAAELAANSQEATSVHALEAREHVIASLQKAITLQAQTQPKPKEEGGKATTETEVTASGSAVVQSYHDQVQNADGIAKAMNTISANREAQQKLLARLRLLWSSLALPSPKSAPVSIKEALAMAALSLQQSGVTSKSTWRESLRQLAKHPYIKFGAPVAAAGTLAVIYPPFAEFAYSSLDMMRMVFSTMWGKVADGGKLTLETAIATLKGFDPYVLNEVYLANGNGARLAVGMTAAFSTLVVALGTPHLITNSVKLYRDLNNPDLIPEHSEAGLIRRFIARENYREELYLGNLADSDAKGQREFSPEEDREIQKILYEIREKEKNWMGHLGDYVKNLSIFKSKKATDHKLNSFSGALMHFLFSACSFTQSGDAYARIWNGWFMFRSLALRPIVSTTLFYYPQYFRVATSSRKGITIPTEFNGGLIPFYSWHVKEFEQHILPIERAIEHASLKHAFIALMKEMNDPEGFKDLVAASGVETIDEHVINELTARHRNFFKHFYMRANDLAMKKFLSRLINDDSIEPTSAYEYKMATASFIGQANTTPEETTKKVEEIVAEIVNDSNFVPSIKKDLASWSTFMTRFGENFNIRIAATLNPKNNRQTRRYQSVNHQLKNPQAMARAVRATVASIVVDKPLELALMLVCLAGITEGINKPLHEEMFGPNSWFYLGRYPFFTGYVVGLLMQTMSDIWMKLQQDELHEGEFGDRPSGKKYEEGKAGFFSYYKEKFFSPKNTLWQNQKHFIGIIWANMPAALVTFLVTNTLTLGRLDLDTYATGYLLAYLLPTNGLAFKIEQAYELAVGYFKKDIPEKYDGHPAVQKYLVKRTGIARIWFNLYYKTYENLLGFFLGNLQTIKTDELGSRSFTRWIFGGFTPTELVLKGLNYVQGSSIGRFPGVQQAVYGCQKLFGNNYTDGDLL